MDIRRQGERSRAAVTLLCVLLISVSAFVQAAHFHPSRAGSERTCPVCVVGQHSGAVSLAAAHGAPQLVVVFSRVVPAGVDVASYLGVAALFIRPPPAL